MHFPLTPVKSQIENSKIAFISLCSAVPFDIVFGL
jgi:hypothetical protein